MVVRRIRISEISFVTVYLALLLVVPSRLTSTMVTNFLVVVHARRFAVAALVNHACLPSSVRVMVTKLAKFRIQAAARINEWVPTIPERVGVFVAVEAMSLVFSEGSGAGGGREKATPEERVVDLKRGNNGEHLCIMMIL